MLKRSAEVYDEIFHYKKVRQDSIIEMDSQEGNFQPTKVQPWKDMQDNVHSQANSKNYQHYQFFHPKTMVLHYVKSELSIANYFYHYCKFYNEKPFIIEPEFMERNIIKEITNGDKKIEEFTDKFINIKDILINKRQFIRAKFNYERNFYYEFRQNDDTYKGNLNLWPHERIAQFYFEKLELPSCGFGKFGDSCDDSDNEDSCYSSRIIIKKMINISSTFERSEKTVPNCAFHWFEKLENLAKGKGQLPDKIVDFDIWRFMKLFNIIFEGKGAKDLNKLNTLLNTFKKLKDKFIQEIQFDDNYGKIGKSGRPFKKIIQEFSPVHKYQLFDYLHFIDRNLKSEKYNGEYENDKEIKKLFFN